NEVTFLAGVDQFLEAGMPMPPAAIGVHGSWVHARDEKRIVPDVLARGTLRIKGWCGAVDRVRGENHLRQIFDRIARLIAPLVPVFGLGKLAEQMGHITGHLRVVKSQRSLVTVADRLVEEGFERMTLSLHRRLL